MKNTQRLFVQVAALSAVAAGAQQSQAATIIGEQGFEGTGLNYTITGTGGAVSSTSLSTDNPASSRIRSGTSSYQSTGQGTAGAAVLTFDPIDVSAYDQTVVEIRLAAISTTSANGLDSTDFIRFYVALDGAAFGTTADLSIGGNANSRYSYTSGTGVASTTAGTPVTFTSGAGTATTLGYSTIRIAIPDSANSFSLRINSNSDANEIWAVDDVSVSVPEPTALALVGLGGTLAMARRRRQSR